MIPDNKSKNNDVFSVWLWVLIIASFFLGIWSLSLHTSDQEKFIDAPTFLVANIAILSTIIVVCALVVTVAGLQKLEAIEQKAILQAKRQAKRQAKKTTSKFLKSEGFREEFAKALKKEYTPSGESLASSPSKSKDETKKEQDD